GELLAGRGAELVVTDAVPARIEQAVERFGARAVAPEQILAEPCEVFAPCALGGCITEAVAETLPARGVCGAANNVFAAPAAAAALHARGVLAVPDFVANAGALIAGATWHLTGERVGHERIRRIGATAAELLARARSEGRPPHEIALELANERLAAAGAGGVA
ncbi:MAG: amino acid dehydrogenase, partial [Planctomycetes bacterium]|nr:amino acid dehydrogenase [Planctomycetota bacterium]